MAAEQEKAIWEAMVHSISDRMKVFTRPYVTILSGGTPGLSTKIGTGTLLDRYGVQLLTCEHVSRSNPDGIYVDRNGHMNFTPGLWCAEPSKGKDVAVARLPVAEWEHISPRAQPLAMAKFAQRHAPVPNELIFFRGIAGENAHISSFGPDVILTGYCSQEKAGTNDAEVFEILWEPGASTVTLGTDQQVRARLKYDDPAGFSGSLVWNTRFVELGCNPSTWSPNEAVVTGLLRRFDPATKTLLAWRVEHLLEWLL